MKCSAAHELANGFLATGRTFEGIALGQAGWTLKRGHTPLLSIL